MCWKLSWATLSVITDIFFHLERSRNQKFAFRLRFQIFCSFFAGKFEDFAQVRKKTLHSICLQIHTDYVTFLFEKRFLQKGCKEHSIVSISALMIINNWKLFGLFIDAIDCFADV